MRTIESMSRLEKLNAKGLVYILSGIFECLDSKIVSEEEIKTLKKLEGDDRIIAGRRISDYANALLNILNVKQYAGNNEDVVELIAAWST